jgi:hypothetical protein
MNGLFAVILLIIKLLRRYRAEAAAEIAYALLRTETRRLTCCDQQDNAFAVSIDSPIGGGHRRA